MLTSPRDESRPGPHTWADFVALDEDDLRELIDGDFVEVEVPTKLHEHIVMLLGYFLTAWSRPRRAGLVLSSGYKIRVSEKRGVMPDVQFYRHGNPGRREEAGLVDGHPDLVVEVLSRSSRRYDRVVKLQWYAEIGVPEYWLVDPEERTLERLLLRDGHYLIAETRVDNEVFRPETFEELEIPLAELWALPDGGE